MTRINVIPVEELSDQHLIAEYHELPRVIKQKVNIKNASDFYVLGTGHIKWAKKHSWFCICRYEELCDEMLYRGFKVNYPHEELLNLYYSDPGYQGYGYVVITQDIFKSRQRIKEKINKMPEYYTWTKRTKPRWLTNKYVSIVGEKL